MAITVTPVRTILESRGIVADVTFDNNYPAGGYAVLASQFGVKDIQWLEARQLGVGSRIVEFDGVGKLKIFTALGTEAVAASDQSAITVRCLVLGPKS